MDKEQARFILQSFRPDGADAGDPEFAEALGLAAADRELGDWLARERAQDAAFASALADVAIPEDLRESILTVLGGGGVESEWTPMDEAFVGALASVRAPAGLRDQILTAMAVEAGGGLAEAPRRTWNWLRTASIAAALVLGAWVAFQVPGGSGGGSELTTLTPVALERGAIDALDSKTFELKWKNPDHAELFEILAKHKLPTPKALPEGLKGAPAVGCRLLQVEGHNASLVCFRMKDSGMIHLVVVDLDEVDGDEFGLLAEVKKKCRQCPKSGWTRVSWHDDERAFMLLGKMKPEEMLEAF